MIHKRLATLLGDKDTFYQERARSDSSLLKVSSLDILAYAYLKYQLVNTRESKEVKALKQSYPVLCQFVKRIDQAKRDD